MIYGLPNIIGSHYKVTSGVVNVGIAGIEPRIQYGQMSFGRNVLLSGTLNITLENEFLPQPGQRFEIIVVRGKITGDFTIKNIPFNYKTYVVSKSSVQVYTVEVV